MKIVSFDFTERKDAQITWDELKTGISPALFYWVELEGSDEAMAKEVLSFFHINSMAVEEFLGPDREGRYDVYDDCLHFALTEGVLKDARLVSSPLDVVLGAQCLIMMHRQPAWFTEQMRRTYREDFRRFAQSPGFLLYELGDHLIDSYRRTFARFAEEVEKVQMNLFGAVDDEIFQQVSLLTSDLLAFRKTVLSSRELMHQLSSRRSPFVSETTQPSLELMAVTLERMSDDLTTERVVLSEMLNLYMGMVSHRTNRIINRLTIISMIFLPLTFICGVYGMNFDVMPELGWAYSYPIFWAVCVIFVGCFVLFIRKKKWI